MLQRGLTGYDVGLQWDFDIEYWTVREKTRKKKVMQGSGCCWLWRWRWEIFLAVKARLVLVEELESRY